MISNVEQARREVRASFWSRVFVAYMVTMVTAVLFGLLYLNVRDGERIEQNREIQGVIRDCVTPTGACYRDNEAKRKRTVAEINRYSVLAAACALAAPLDAPTAERERLITLCIVDRLADDTPKS